MRGSLRAGGVRRGLRPAMLVWLVLMPMSCSSQDDETRGAASSATTSCDDGAAPDRSDAKVVQFTPDIRIDYRKMQVEVRGRVILREGSIELFAYSAAPVPKEHESIVLLQARASSIYQALGLIGLHPGEPMRYFPERRTLREPSGDAVDVRVRYERGGETIEDSACAWMRDVELDAPMEETHWLFTGSVQMKDGRFAADVEGTSVTVVDFPSALLALPGMHSSSDDQLWLAANTEAIPPLGTPVTLILRSAMD